MKRMCIIIGMIAAGTMMISCARSTRELDGLEARDPLVRSADAKEREGDKDSAILLLRKALDKNPGLALAHLRIALLYDDHAKDYAPAIYHYRRYLDMRPDTEKREMLLDRIRDAEVLFCAALSGRPVAGDRDYRALREENVRLKRDLHQVRRNLAELSAASAAARARVSDSHDGAPPSIVEDDGGAEHETRGRVYVVGRGDTLSSIAAQEYQDPRGWRRIYDANRDLIGSDPSALKAGQKLIIPD